LLYLSISHFHHYPGLLGRFRCRTGFCINSEISFKLIWPWKSNLLHVEKILLLNTGPGRKQAWGRQKIGTKITWQKQIAASSLCWQSVQDSCCILFEDWRYAWNRNISGLDLKICLSLAKFPFFYKSCVLSQFWQNLFTIISGKLTITIYLKLNDFDYPNPSYHRNNLKVKKCNYFKNKHNPHSRTNDWGKQIVKYPCQLVTNCQSQTIWNKIILTSKPSDHTK